MPAVVIGTPEGAGSLPAVWQDDAAATRAVVEYLAGLGHRRIARVTGIPRLWHTKIRTDAFRAATRAVGLEAVWWRGTTPARGGPRPRPAAGGPHPPTAIVYDNDLMAVSGLSAAQQKGVEVPAELSIVAWDDSALCQVVHPPLTALTPGRGRVRRPRRAGLAQAAAGAEVGNQEEPTPVLTIRGSTGHPAGSPPGPPRGRDPNETHPRFTDGPGRLDT